MKRLNYIDGLKGWCAASVCIQHFLLMFVIGGFIGWKCLPEAKQNPFEYYFEWFHLVFTYVNTSFVHVVNSPLFSEQQNRFRADLFRKTD